VRARAEVAGARAASLQVHGEEMAVVTAPEEAHWFEARTPSTDGNLACQL
jgi:hypothetical protein